MRVISVVSEQQETLSKPGISSNIQNGTIADDVRMNGGYAASVIMQRTPWAPLQVDATARSSVAFAGDTCHPKRLTDALPQWWHLNNNRGEINTGIETALLKSWRSGSFINPLREADYRNANSK
ncbi:MAG: hypothetical protein ACPHJ3_18245 [Rubripirellula sp.]